MNPYPAEYRVQEMSGTASNVACAVLLASLAAASLPSMPPADFPTVHPIQRPSTIGQFIFNDTAQSTTTDFEGAVTAFYSTLLAKQQPLGKEFEKVLYDNLWDLYVRS
jgi:hypothetical protein